MLGEVVLRPADGAAEEPSDGCGDHPAGADLSVPGGAVDGTLQDLPEQCGDGVGAEEPRNNGVYPFIGAKLHYHWIGMKKLYYVGRKPSASPAAGSYEQHNKEQADIIARALGIGDAVAAAGPSRENRPLETRLVETKADAKGNVEVSVSKEAR